MKRLVNTLFVVFSIIALSVNHSYADDEVWIDAKDRPSKTVLNLPSFAPVIEKLGQSVVNISIEGREEVSKNVIDLGDLFNQRRPFNGGKGKSETHRPFSSLGSGFVIHPDGYIVTNNHVIEKATKIKVSFKNDKKKYNAKIIGSDSKTDVALLKVDYPKPLKAAVLGNSETVKPGDWVIAIGNPFRLGHTATVGIVSAKSRRVVGTGPYADFIQTDASINPGNSGGPLFNAKGEVVGINTAIFSPGRFGGTGGFNIGIGFATPINIAKKIISQLHDSGKVTRGWLGVLIQGVSVDVADALGLDSPIGALVADVIPEGPAKKAGVKRGDVIIGFDGNVVEENDDLPWMVAQTKIGKKAKLLVIRNGKEKSLNVTIEELDESKIKTEKTESTSTENEKLGLSLQNLTPDLAATLGIEDTEGVIVSDVAIEGPAVRSGFKRGDIVVEVAGKAIKTTNDFEASVSKLKKNKPLLFLVKRGQNTIFLTLKIEQ